MSAAPLGGGVQPDAVRRAELVARLATVRARIAAACADAGREPAEITLVAVTKFFPAADVRLLAELGVTDVGENRDQEAAPKARACADLRLRWHFVGQLQRNKAASVLGYAAVVHSVDRPALVERLATVAVAAGRRPACLVQVRLDDPAGSSARGGRGGAATAAARELADLVAAAPGLRLAGVMGVAPLGGDPDRAFARLARVAADIRGAHPEAGWISAGMSADLESAIRHGATHVRIGTALLGPRPPAPVVSAPTGRRAPARGESAAETREPEDQGT